MKKKTKNSFIFWNILAASFFSFLLFFRLWITNLRLEFGYFTAPSWIINLDSISIAVINALIIGWVMGNIFAKTKK